MPRNSHYNQHANKGDGEAGGGKNRLVEMKPRSHLIPEAGGYPQGED